MDCLTQPRYTAALVGLGRIAWRFDASGPAGPAATHWGAYRREPRTELICGFSPVPQERSAFQEATGTETCDSFEQVLQRRPDIVSICSPSEAHFQQVLACLDQAVPMVWLEKPPTLRLGDLDKLLEHPSYRSGRTKVLVNYMRRYSRLYERLRSIHREQLLGRPVAAQVLYSRELELNGSHFLDFIFSMTGDQPPTAVTVGESERGKPCPTFLLQFAEDFTVSVGGHDVAYHISDVALVCANGRATVLSGGLEARVEEKTENERYPGFFRLRTTASSLLATTEPEDSFSEALNDLLAAHEADRAPHSSLATARLTQAVMETVRNG